MNKSGPDPNPPPLPDYLIILESAKALAFLTPWEIPAILRVLSRKSARHGNPRTVVSHVQELPTHFIAGVLRADAFSGEGGEAFTAVCASRARAGLKQMREIVTGLENS